MSGRPGAENTPSTEQRGDVKLAWRGSSVCSSSSSFPLCPPSPPCRPRPPFWPLSLAAAAAAALLVTGATAETKLYSCQSPPPRGGRRGRTKRFAWTPPVGFPLCLAPCAIELRRLPGTVAPVTVQLGRRKGGCRSLSSSISSSLLPCHEGVRAGGLGKIAGRAMAK